MFKSKFITYLLYFVIFIVFLSSVIDLYVKRKPIADKISSIFESQDANISNITNVKSSDRYWAKKIFDGNYILHFRHAERDKWIDVTKYDALESDLHDKGENESRYAENDYFADAVCLNARGKIQAKAMGEHIDNYKLPIGSVVSSVSCRARQTAELAFGGYNSLHRLLVHVGPYDEDPQERLQNLIDFYTNLEIIEGSNTIVSAHNSVVTCEMFINCNNSKLFLEEGGFFVISKKNNGLYLEHEFNNFNDFNRYMYKR